MADRKLILIGTAATVALIAVGGVYLGKRQDDRLAGCGNGVVAGGLDAYGGEFTLTRQDGQRVTAEQIFTKPSLLYFGYTSCPDVCPLDSARNADAVALLADKGKDVQAVFVTVDPRRDTPEILSDFTSLFPGNMIGLTGSDEEIANVNQSWRNYYKAQDQDDKDYYLVDHMTNTYLVMPGNHTLDFFGRDASSEQVAEGVACFMDAIG